MTTLATPSPARSTVTPSRRLQTTMAAVRVSFVWLGVRKTLTPDQKSQAAETFGAEGQYLSAAKKLLDTRHPAFRAVGTVHNRIVSYWKGMSLPYPEPGLRLIRQDHVERFHERMTEMQEELAAAVTDLDRQYDELRSAARRRLGSLYDPADYPSTVKGLFEVQWDFPSVEPPNYLLQLNPALYEQEQRRMSSRFDEAVRLAEEAFTSEFGRLLDHLAERLSGSEDGKPRVFRDSAITNLQEFFERFRSLNVRSSQQLDELVETAQRSLKNVQPQQLRESSNLRQKIASQFSAMSAAVEGMMVDRPRRRVLRQPLQEKP